MATVRNTELKQLNTELHNDFGSDRHLNAHFERLLGEFSVHKGLERLSPPASRAGSSAASPASSATSSPRLTPRAASPLSAVAAEVEVSAGCVVSESEAAAAVAAAPSDVLIFGYGSLVWKAPDHASSFHATLRGYYRRFYQMSPDHRGTPEAMGRVCTLVPAAALAAAATAASAAGRPHLLSPGEQPVVHGTVFRLHPDRALDTLSELCYREKAGYQALRVPVVDEAGATHHAFVFTATPDNDFAAFYEEDAATAGVIATAAGPSGTNLQYFTSLLDALRGRGVRDPHMESLAALLRLPPPAPPPAPAAAEVAEVGAVEVQQAVEVVRGSGDIVEVVERADTAVCSLSAAAVAAVVEAEEAEAVTDRVTAPCFGEP